MRVRAGHKYKRRDGEKVYLEWEGTNCDPEYPYENVKESSFYYKNGRYYEEEENYQDLIKDLGLVVDVGSTYRTRNEDLVIIEKEDMWHDTDQYPFRGTNGDWYSITGLPEPSRRHKGRDLIELAKPEEQLNKEITMPAKKKNKLEVGETYYDKDGDEVLVKEKITCFVADRVKGSECNNLIFTERGGCVGTIGQDRGGNIDFDHKDNKVELNDEYTAEINKDDETVTVGCTTIDFDKIEELYKAMKK